MQTRFHLRYAPYVEFYHSTVMLSMTALVVTRRMDSTTWYDRQLDVPGFDCGLLKHLNSLSIGRAQSPVEKLVAELLVRMGVHGVSSVNSPSFISSMVRINPFVRETHSSNIELTSSSGSNAAIANVSANSYRLAIPSEATPYDSPVLSALLIDTIKKSEGRMIDLPSTRPPLMSHPDSTSNSRVMVVGAGGLGCPAISHLLNWLKGSLAVVDHDTVAVTDLHRQVFYTLSDVGRKKAKVLPERLSKGSQELHIVAFDKPFSEELLDHFKPDMVVSAVDNTSTRREINRICVERSIDVVDAGVNDYGGYITSYTVGSACYVCTIGSAAMRDEKKKGILTMTSYHGGMLLARYAVELLVNKEALRGKIFVFDLSRFIFEAFDVERNKRCEVCGGNR